MLSPTNLLLIRHLNQSSRPVYLRLSFIIIVSGERAFVEGQQLRTRHKLRIIFLLQSSFGSIIDVGEVVVGMSNNSWFNSSFFHSKFCSCSALICIRNYFKIALLLPPIKIFQIPNLAPRNISDVKAVGFWGE